MQRGKNEEMAASAIQASGMQGVIEGVVWRGAGARRQVFRGQANHTIHRSPIPEEPKAKV